MDPPCFGFYNEKDVVLDRPLRTFFHCVHVRGVDRSGKVLGYVELFGYQRLIVLLSNTYSGRRLSKSYSVDPVAGKEIDLTVELPEFNSEEIQAIYDFKKVDLEKTSAAVGNLIEWYLEESGKRERSRALEAVEYAFDNCGVKPGGGNDGGAEGAFCEAVAREIDAVPIASANDSGVRSR